ncbi:MAG: type II secretion system protein GspK [Planctomycetaceae bacterium]
MKPRRQSGSRDGVVLIVVLVLVMMIALAGFGFLAAMSTEYEGARLNGNMLQAQQTLASAESVLNWFTGLTRKEQLALGGWYHNPRLFRGRLVEPLGPVTDASSTTMTGLADEPPLETGAVDDRWRFSVVSLDSGPDQNAVLRFGLQDESSKLHLANILRWEQASPGQGRAALMQLPGMTDAVADCILDWMDSDTQPRESGAESDYYQTLDRPYAAANTVPQRLSELLYVKGVTRRMLFGIRNADPMATDSQMLPESISSGSDSNFDSPQDPSLAGLGWKHFLTLNSAERNQNQSGQPRIFLNADSLAPLEQQLTAVLPQNLVRYILLARVYGVSLTPGSGVEPAAAAFSVSMAPAFPITSPADLIDSVIQLPASAGGIVVQSPLQSSSPDFPALVTAFFDNVTTVRESTIPGRINIANASETVLRTIPGMTSELISQIVTVRDSLETPQADSVAWLLFRNVVSLEMFRKLFPEITVGGDVFQCEIVVHRSIGGPTLRQNLMLDAASSPTKRLQWMDVSETRLQYSQRLLVPSRP